MSDYFDNAIRDSIDRALRERALAEEAAVFEFFGSEERAWKMMRLFPGRYRQEIQHLQDDGIGFDFVPAEKWTFKDMWTGRKIVRLFLFRVTIT